MNDSSKRRMAWLDLFRGLAAVMIVVFHYSRFLGLRNFGFGFVAVDGFFVLSGIVLAMKYTDAIAAGMPFRSFVAARLTRLYPMVFIAGLLVVALNVAGAPANYFMGSGPNGVWRIFLLLVPKVGEWAAPTSAAFPADVPVWSLWAELAANAIWFMAIRAGRRWVAWMGVTTMLCLVALACRQHSLDIGWDSSVSTRLFTVVRALAWFCVGHAIARTGVKPVVSPSVLVVGLAAFFVAFYCGVPPSWGSEFAMVALGAALLHALYHASAPGAWVSKGATLLGLLSYPLYLVHGPAGRLLPCLSDALPPAIALGLLVAPIAIVATVLNEWVVGRLHRRRLGAPALAEPA